MYDLPAREIKQRDPFFPETWGILEQKIASLSWEYVKGLYETKEEERKEEVWENTTNPECVAYLLSPTYENEK